MRCGRVESSPRRFVLKAEKFELEVDKFRLLILFYLFYLILFRRALSAQ